jgi:peptide/nickel transport system substrate-binding protein
MFDHRVPGDHVTVIKSPHYYNQGAVHLDKIVYKPMPDQAAAAAALRAGDIHVLDTISPAELPAIRQESGLRVLEQRSLGWTGIYINIGNKNGTGKLPYTNVGTPLASNAKLRQAFEEALDRDTIIRVVDNGAGVPGCTPISPASPAFDASVKCTPYDPTHAKKLVAASGFPNPTVHLLTSAGTRLTRLAQVIQAMEAEVGINVVIDQADGPTVQAKRAAGRFDTYLGAYTGGLRTDGNIYQFVATDGSANHSGYSNPRLDLILANSRKAMSIAALKTLYHAAEQILVDDRPLIFLSHSIRYQAVDTSVTGVYFDANSAPVVAFAQFK